MDGVHFLLLLDGKAPFQRSASSVGHLEVLGVHHPPRVLEPPPLLLAKMPRATSPLPQILPLFQLRSFGLVAINVTDTLAVFEHGMLD